MGLSGLQDGLGTWALSPLGHWDMDELLDLMIWTRNRVGPDGLSIVHNTMVPMAATENFADYVVAMEWGYSRLSQGAPGLSELPLEWNFMGARSRGVIGYGCLEPDAPERVHRQMTLRCLLTGVAPWPALDLDLDMFAPLAGRDLSGFAFRDCLGQLASVHEPDAGTAVYCSEEQSLVLVGDLSGEARRVCCTLDLTGTRLRQTDSYRVSVNGEAAESVGPEDFKTMCLMVPLEADGLSLVTIEPE